MTKTLNSEYLTEMAVRAAVGKQSKLLLSSAYITDVKHLTLHTSSANDLL